MIENEIIEYIREFERDTPERANDNGKSLFRSLAISLNKTKEPLKTKIIKFYLNEIESNKNGYSNLGLQVIVEAKLEYISPELENIFYLNYNSKDFDWKSELIFALLELNYTKPTKLYTEFITFHLNKKIQDVFYHIVMFYHIDSINGLEILSDYYTSRLISKKSFEYGYDHHFAFLIHKLIDNVEKIIALIEETYAKNIIAGQNLKDIILSYLYKKKQRINYKDVSQNVQLIEKINI